MENKNLIAPIVHLNGTSYDSLIEQYTDSINAISKALEKLPHPHGRDYYVHPNPEALTKAQEQLKGWQDKLNSVVEELETITIKIADRQV